MNLEAITETLKTSGYMGHTISTEENIILSNSLLILQNENHFSKIYFWGRIFGVEKDYYIVYGYVKDALHGKIYYYSTNCIDWGLLPLPVDKAKQLLILCTTKFQGDPALVTDILIEKDETGIEEVRTGPKVMKLKEEDRLSATVHMITIEAVVIPRGALFRRPDGIIIENRSFEGLKSLESQEISSYLHYRVPLQKWNTNLLNREDYNYAMDFLDPLDIDIPEGCWSIQFCRGDTIVILKPLYWPGMIFYHYLETNKHGFVYFGHGKKSLDVPFLLHPL